MNNYTMEELDARLNQILDRKLEDLAVRLKKTEEQDGRERRRVGASRTDRTFWGVFLVVLGGLWLADRMQWLNISAGWLWPSLLIGFGLYLVLGGRGR
jgi:hypothetical protein